MKSDDPLDDVLQRIAYELLIYHEHKAVLRDQFRMDEPDVWPDITGWREECPSTKEIMARLDDLIARRMSTRI